VNVSRVGAVFDLDGYGRVLLDMASEREPCHLRQLDRASAGSRFQLAKVGRLTHKPLELVAHVQLSREKVDLPQFEPHDLAWPKPAARGDIRDSADLGGKRVNLVRRWDVEVPTRDLGEPDTTARRPTPCR